MFVGKIVAIVDFASFISLLLSYFVDVLSSAVEAKRYHKSGIEVGDTVPIKNKMHVIPKLNKYIQHALHEGDSNTRACMLNLACDRHLLQMSKDRTTPGCD